MKRSLTAELRNRTGLPALILVSALLLASCNNTTPPNTGGGTGGGTTGSLSATVEQPVVTGVNAQGLVRVSSTSASSLTVTVSSAPSGLTVTPGTPSASGSDAVFTVSATGDVPSGSKVSLTVSAGDKSATVSVPVLSFTARKINPAGATSSVYQASAIQAQADGTLLLRAPASGDEQQRHSLLKFDPATGNFNFIPFPVTGFETITSSAIAPDGRVWVTVRGVTAAGSSLYAMNASGQTQKFLAGTTDTLNGLTATPDGQVWYTQYVTDKVVALNPSTNALTPYAVQENAENLTQGKDGNLYYTQFYANPAIVQLNPKTGVSKSFPVGTPNVSLPTALTAATNGTLYFIESRTGSVWNLDPATGKQSKLPLPTGAHPTDLAAAPDGTLWVADPSAGLLYRVASGASSAASIPALKAADGTPSGPRALTVTPDGKLWYEADGKLVTMN